jgi:hypothetical protein
LDEVASDARHNIFWIVRAKFLRSTMFQVQICNILCNSRIASPGSKSFYYAIIKKNGQCNGYLPKIEER